MKYQDAIYYYQFNSRGDIIGLTDTTGKLVTTYEYDPWGNIKNEASLIEPAKDNSYRYVGKYGVFYDKDTKMYHMTWRDYDPSIGRFIVPDTYRGISKDILSQNRYLYAHGDPVNYVDPSGHKPAVHHIDAEGSYIGETNQTRNSTPSEELNLIYSSWIKRSYAPKKGKSNVREIVFPDEVQGKINDEPIVLKPNEE